MSFLQAPSSNETIRNEKRSGFTSLIIQRPACVLVCLLASAALAYASDIPSGTQLEIRLTSTVDSATAKVKDPVQAVVIAPVVAGEEIVMAAGAKVEGQIKEVKQPVKPDEQAVVQVEFEKLLGAGGQKTSLSARVVSVDNARETVDEKGRILGIIASQTGSSRLDQGISKVAQRYPGLGDILGVAKGAVVKEADPSIHYEPGVEMTIELTKPLTWNETSAGPNVQAITPAERLAELVNDEPKRTVALKPPSPSDVTNILFIGTREQLEDAFAAAGWTPAHALNEEAKLETFRALVEGRGYKEGPVSTLLLDGKPPDMVFQKTNNTFAARHHLRIWQRPETFDGKRVWVCSSTHDIGIDFSERDHTFIHRTDPQIDRERAKVVNDLLFTGKVHALALVERPNAITSGQNATGDEFKTDGRMAVVEF